jgi:hypothetical protein
MPRKNIQGKGGSSHTPQDQQKPLDPVFNQPKLNWIVEPTPDGLKDMRLHIMKDHVCRIGAWIPGRDYLVVMYVDSLYRVIELKVNLDQVCYPNALPAIPIADEADRVLRAAIDARKPKKLTLEEKEAKRIEKEKRDEQREKKKQEEYERDFAKRQVAFQLQKEKFEQQNKDTQLKLMEQKLDREKKHNALLQAQLAAASSAPASAGASAPAAGAPRPSASAPEAGASAAHSEIEQLQAKLDKLEALLTAGKKSARTPAAGGSGRRLDLKHLTPEQKIARKRANDRASSARRKEAARKATAVRVPADAFNNPNKRKPNSDRSLDPPNN